MGEFDDLLPQRRFDNFQFVYFNTVFRKYPKETRDAAFAVHALMEIPEQYDFVKRAGMLGGVQSAKCLRPHSSWQPPLGPPEASLSREPEEEENPQCGTPEPVAVHGIKPAVGLHMAMPKTKVPFAY